MATERYNSRLKPFHKPTPFVSISVVFTMGRALIYPNTRKISSRYADGIRDLKKKHRAARAHREFFMLIAYSLAPAWLSILTISSRFFWVAHMRAV
jgi:hypothetical protein